MTKINPQALENNEILQKENPIIYAMLSKRGQLAFFPKKGILAQAAMAKGKEINASAGIALEDDGTPVKLSSISNRIDLNPADAFLYAPSYGVPQLRKKWKEMLFVKNPTLAGKPISTPIVSCALTHGLSIVGNLFLNEGDEIILPDLFWGNYNLVFKNNYGAKFSTFNFFKDQGMDMESFKNVITSSKSQKKIVLLNFPNNPSGYTPTEDEVLQIINILKDAAKTTKQMIVILDDAYTGLVFDNNIYQESIFALLADAAPNLLAIKLDGITKEDYAWGFRVGFITYGIKDANEKTYSILEDKTAGAVRGNISNAPKLSQSLVLKAFEDPYYQSEKEEKFNLLQKRFNLVSKIFKNNPKYKEFFTPLPFNSGYFLCIKLLKNEVEEVRLRLLEKYDTGVISCSNLLRMAYSSTPTDKLEKLFDNIYKACRDGQ